MNYITDLANGLDILEKYGGQVQAEHNFIYITINATISAPDHDALIKLGWENNQPDVLVWVYQTGVILTIPSPPPIMPISQ